MLALLEPSQPGFSYSGGFQMSKVKIRLMSASLTDVQKLRPHFLKKHPQSILGKPMMGKNPRYEDSPKWFVYGDYEFGKIRRRRGE